MGTIRFTLFATFVIIMNLTLPCFGLEGCYSTKLQEGDIYEWKFKLEGFENDLIGDPNSGSGFAIYEGSRLKLKLKYDLADMEPTYTNETAYYFHAVGDEEAECYIDEVQYLIMSDDESVSYFLVHIVSNLILPMKIIDKWQEWGERGMVLFESDGENWHMEVPSPLNVTYEGNHESGIITKFYQPFYDESAGQSMELNLITSINESESNINFLPRLYIIICGIFLLSIYNRRNKI